MDGVRFMNSVNTSRSGKKDSYNALSTRPALGAYARELQSDCTVPSHTPNNTSTTNIMHGMKNTKTSMKGKTVNYHSPAEAPRIASYPISVPSNEIDSKFSPDSINSTRSTTYTNSGEDQFNGKTGTESYCDQPTAAPVSATHSGSFLPGQTHSNVTRGIDAIYRTHGRNNENNINNVQDIEQGGYHPSAAPLRRPAYPSSFRSEGIDSSCSDNMYSMNSLNDATKRSTVRNSRTNNYRKQTPMRTTTTYPSAFQTDEMNSSFNPNVDTGYNTTSLSNANATMNGNINNNYQTAAPQAGRTCSTESRSGPVDSSFANNTIHVINPMNNAKTTEKAKARNYKQPTALSASATYPGDLQSRGRDSGFTDIMHTTNSTNKANKLNTTPNSMEGTSCPPAPSPTTNAYHGASEINEVDSSFTNNARFVYDTISTNNANTTNYGSKYNQHQRTAPDARTTYPTASWPSEVDASFTQTPNTDERIKSINSATTTKSTMASNYHQIMEPPASAPSPSTNRLCEIGTNSGFVNDNNMYLTQSMNDINTTKSGREGNYDSSMVSPPVTGRSTKVQSSDVDIRTGMNAAAWEEHLDLATGTKYFYNNITMRVSRSTCV